MKTIISYLFSRAALALLLVPILSCTFHGSSHHVSHGRMHHRPGTHSMLYANVQGHNRGPALVECQVPEIEPSPFAEVLARIDEDELTIDTMKVDSENDGPRIHRVWVKVTACSPQDRRDRAYYRKHGYKGKPYNISAFLLHFPKGTKMRVPGYMDQSYPNKWWTVDSSGGSVIRRAASRGVKQIDVKYRTEYSAKKWGVQWMWVEVIYPEDVVD